METINNYSAIQISKEGRATRLVIVYRFEEKEFMPRQVEDNQQL